MAAKKLTKPRLFILSGIFAVTNMGMAMPSKAELDRAIKHPPTSVNNSVMMFAQQYMETDEHADMFCEEAKGWFKDLSKLDEEKIATTWRDVAPILKAMDVAGL